MRVKQQPWHSGFRVDMLPTSRPSAPHRLSTQMAMTMRDCRNRSVCRRRCQRVRRPGSHQRSIPVRVSVVDTEVSGRRFPDSSGTYRPCFQRSLTTLNRTREHYDRSRGDAKRNSRTYRVGGVAMADRYDEPDQGSDHASDEDRCDDRREDPMPGQEAPGLCVHGGELLIRRQRTAVDVEGGFTATWFDLGATTLMAGRSG